MKKTFLSFLFIGLCLASMNPLLGQALIDEDFSTATGTTPPAGWTISDIAGSGDSWVFDNPGSRTLNAPISDPAAIFDSDELSNNSLAENITLESPVFDASGLATVVLQFDHYFRGLAGGAYDVEAYDGSTWQTVIAGPLTASTSNPQSESIDISSYVAGVANAQVRFHWTGDWSWYWIVDNVKVLPCTSPSVSATPLCNGVDGNNFYVDVTTTFGSGTAYTISNSFDATTYPVTLDGATVQIGPFPNGASVDVTVTDDADAACDDTATGLTEDCTPPPTGSVCSDPILVASLPYTETGGTTDGFGDDYGSGDACSSSYMGGDDIVYSYTPAADECIDITLSNTDATADVGVFLLDACPDDPAANCVASDSADNTSPAISGASLTAGTTYFIVISTWPAPQTTAFDLEIAACPLCTNPSVSATEVCNGVDENNFYVDVTTTFGSGTAYTISNSFDATTYPATVDGATVQIGPFPNGASVDVTVTDDADAACDDTATGLTEDCTPPPTGSVCADPILVASLPYTETGGTTDGFGDDYGSGDACGSSYMGGDDIVYSYTPAADECIDITLTNTDDYVGLFLLDACPDDPAANCVAFNTQIGGNPAISGASLTGGITYFIVISTWPLPDFTPFDLEIAACTPPPTGSVCADPIVVASLPYTETGGTTDGFGDDYGSTDACASIYMGGDDIVYSYTPTADECIDITLTNTDATADVGVFLLDACPDDPAANCVASDSADNTSPAISGASLTAGTTYFIVISTWPAPQTTAFDLEIAACPLCTNPSVSATAVCNGVDENNFYVDVTTTFGSGTAYTISNSYDATTYPATVDGATVQIGPFPNGTSVDVTVTDDADAACDDTATGLTEDCTPPPTGSVCADPIVVASLPYTETGGTTDGFGDDYGSTDACASIYMGGDDIVYSYTPAADECIDITLTNTDTYVGVFLLDACPDDPAANCVAIDTNTGGSPAISGASLTAGTTYFIVISTWPAPDFTPFDLEIATCPPPPTGAVCADPIVVASLPYTETGGTTDGFGDDYGSTDACASIYMGGDDIVYSYTPAADECIDITLSNTDATADVGVFLLDACPDDPAANCVASDSADNTSPAISGASLTAGTTYFIVISTWPAPQTTAFDLEIANCSVDCEGTPGGTALPGTTCDDGDPNTGNDLYQADCSCAGEPIDCEGTPGGTALPGTTCDDGDPNTGNDLYQADCSCAGEPIDCEGTPGGTALPGTPCDDGDPSTGNDVYQADCSCAGEPIDCEGTPGGTALPGTTCDDGDPNTGNDVYQADCSCAGEPIDCEGTPGGTALPGTPCDDGDPNTVGDIYQADCSCAGLTEDCLGVPGGTALPGTACDDGDPSTGNDLYQTDCSCAGEPIDCEGTPGGTALPGTACDDGDPSTGNDLYQADCSCAGEPIDCEGTPGGTALPGTACDDGDPSTGNDVYQADCSCAGEPIDCEGTPGGTALPGTACDDGDPSTGNDLYQADCSCAGELIDCEGTPGGTALPGTACDDGDPSTGNDLYQADCSCTGELIDCNGVIGGPDVPGAACDDGDPNTGNDIYQADCTCAGELIDCNGVIGGPDFPGAACNDGDPLTSGDIIQADCTCAGILCPDGDDDNDGVCNSVDACPGFDDNIDANANGIPDGCDCALVISSASSSNAGSPYQYNSLVIEVDGGTAPYHVAWNNSGYVRYSTTYIDGVFTINIIFANDADVNFTVTDNFGCMAEYSSTGATDEPLQITDYNVTAASGSSATDGAVDITVSGGDGNYTYAWSSTVNASFSASTEDVSGIPSGWYTVLVTDGNGDTAYGTYWVPATGGGSTSGGFTRNKTAFDSEQTLTARPNPFSHATTVEFSVAQTGNTLLTVHNMEGKLVARLFNGIADKGQVYTIPFNAAELPAGMYMVKASTDSGSVQYSKLVLMK